MYLLPTIYAFRAGKDLDIGFDRFVLEFHGGFVWLTCSVAFSVILW